MAKKRHLSASAIIGDDVMSPQSTASRSEAPVAKHLAQNHQTAKDTIDKLTTEVSQLQQELSRARAAEQGAASSDSQEKAKEREAELVSQIDSAQAELRSLEKKLEEFPDRGVFELDPNRVRPSRFANRDQLAFRDEDFNDLKQSVREHNGNDIAAKVRRVTNDPNYDYEVVYGHRRHEATKLAGVPFYASIHDLTDLDLVRYMHMENQRLDLSPYEEGAQFLQWMDEGLYKNVTELASAIGESKAFVSQRTAIHSLPKVVFTALRDPRKLGITAWRDLCAAYRLHPEKINNIAVELATGVDEGTPMEESDVRAILLKMLQANKSEPKVKDIKSVATLSGVPLFSAEKRPSGYLIRLDSSGVGEDVQEEALKQLEMFLLDQLSGPSENG